MAKQRLSQDQVKELQKMVIKGVYPDDIARHFGVAVSSIHNYKKRFKDQGIKFPSVKGKRPGNAPMPGDIIQRIVPESNRSNVIGTMNSSHQNSSDYKFIINGMSVLISAHAKSVNISDHSMEIIF